MVGIVSRIRVVREDCVVRSGSLPPGHGSGEIFLPARVAGRFSSRPG